MHVPVFTAYSCCLQACINYIFYIKIVDNYIQALLKGIYRGVINYILCKSVNWDNVNVTHVPATYKCKHHIPTLYYIIELKYSIYCYVRSMSKV